MKTKFHLLILAILCSAQNVWAGHESHGGYAFDRAQELSETKEPIQVWDVMEFGDSFSLSDIPEGKVLLGMLSDLNLRIAKDLKTKESAAIESLQFLTQAIQFSFVTPDLKSVEPSGISQLEIPPTYKRVMAASSDVKRGVTQFNKPIWEKLDQKSRLYLLLHEILWMAEKSPLLYTRQNPELIVKFIPVKDGEVVNLSFVAVTSEDRNPMFEINLADISTTTQSIMAMTGFLMDTLKRQPEDLRVDALFSNILLNVGRVHSHSVYPRTETMQGYDSSGWPVLNIVKWGSGINQGDRIFLPLVSKTAFGYLCSKELMNYRRLKKQEQNHLLAPTTDWLDSQSAKDLLQNYADWNLRKDLAFEFVDGAKESVGLFVPLVKSRDSGISMIFLRLKSEDGHRTLFVEIEDFFFDWEQLTKRAKPVEIIGISSPKVIKRARTEYFYSGSHPIPNSRTVYDPMYTVTFRLQGPNGSKTETHFLQQGLWMSGALDLSGRFWRSLGLID